MMNNKTPGKGMLCQETGAARPVSRCFITYVNCNGVFPESAAAFQALLYVSWLVW